MSPDITPIAIIRAAVHNLKAPAGRLTVFAELLGRAGETPPDVSAKMLLDHIVESSKELQVNIDALHRYATVLGREPQIGTVDLNETLRQVRSVLKAEMEAARATLVTGDLPPVLADRSDLDWIFEELLRNAIRFRGSRLLEISVLAMRDRNVWSIAVDDNGIGVDPALAERLFLPFKRLSGAGAGLGLTICRAALERQGGAIHFSPKQEGARFLITFQLSCQD